MTRDEAIKAVAGALGKSLAFKHMHPVIRAASAEAEVDALVALGVLKLDVSLSERLATLRPEAFSVRNVADVRELRASDWREPARCEPPPEHQDKRWHWLKQTRSGSESPMACQWLGIGWSYFAQIVTPADGYGAGWRYVAPCEEPKL